MYLKRVRLGVDLNDSDLCIGGQSSSSGRPDLCAIVLLLSLSGSSLDLHIFGEKL